VTGHVRVELERRAALPTVAGEQMEEPQRQDVQVEEVLLLLLLLVEEGT